MSWATHYINKLSQGEVVTFRPSGHSMTGRVNHRDLVEVHPVEAGTVFAVGMVVLCRVKGRDFLHIIKRVDHLGRVLIGNNKGGENGWINPGAVFGVMLKNLGQ